MLILTTERKKKQEFKVFSLPILMDHVQLVELLIPVDVELFSLHAYVALHPILNCLNEMYIVLIKKKIKKHNFLSNLPNDVSSIGSKSPSAHESLFHTAFEFEFTGLVII